MTSEPAAITKARFFIPELDALRFIAFMLIFVHHISVTHIFFVDKVRSVGWIGVDIFFCLSAFLLTKLLRIENSETGSVNVLNFFIRRALRIWPLYFTYVIIAIIFSMYRDVITSDNWFRVIGLVTFSDNIFASIYQYNPLLFTGHLWTISYEEQFYLMLPFVIVALTKKSSRQRNFILLLVMITGSFVRLIFIFNDARHPAIWVLPVTHFESILIGVLLGFQDNISNKINPVLFYVAGFISCMAILLLPGTGIISYHLMILYPCIGIASGSVLCLALYSKSQLIERILSGKILIYLGKISFGLYVFHKFSLLLTDYVLRYFGINMTALNIAISLSLTILLASLSYWFLESKFLRMKNNFTVVPSRPV